MFEDFLAFFGIHKSIMRTDDSYQCFLEQLGGQQFGDGVFTSFSLNEIGMWTKIVETAYPGLKRNLKLFGHDWLGRCFAVDLRNNRRGQVLMLEIGTGMALEIPCTLDEFLEEEIILNTDACLAKSFYEEWRARGNTPLKHGNCIGYKVPLFLGGDDACENLEESDMEVYWSILTQVLNQLNQKK